uniref:EGF-like domain-containing protein n=1 Tax=Rhabditophanes sp. KR3021 TaxID=114890 RepID=A0AC35TUW6_9BILA
MINLVGVRKVIKKEAVKTCELGWSGHNCDVADCSSQNNCSGSGYCIFPNECKCILNHYGDDCSLCQGPYCTQCDFQCAHGKCDTITQSCKCFDGWSGPGCDVCLEKGQCVTQPTILMLVPQAGSIQKTNTFTFAHGIDFPQTDSDRYNCIFGGIATEGRWLSPNLVRCLVPPVSNIGKHLFNLIPLNSRTKIKYAENKPIHYTFYLECNPNVCQGSCMGPECMCGMERSGQDCADLNVFTKAFYNQTNYNEELSVAHEGVIYRVNVPIKAETALTFMESDAQKYGLKFDAFKGQLIWQRPIGREQPYEVNVILNQGFIKYSLKWILKVKPSYKPSIITVNSRNLNDVEVKGFIKFDQNIRPFSAPLSLLVFPGTEPKIEQLIETIPIYSLVNGTFEQTLTLYNSLEPNYSMCVRHPGLNSSLGCENSNPYSRGSFKVSRLSAKYEPSLILNSDPAKDIYQANTITAKYIAETENFDCSNAWEMDLLFPRDKISIKKLEFGEENGNEIRIQYVLASNQSIAKEMEMIALIFCPNSGMSTVVRQIIVAENRGFLPIEPSKILITLNPNNRKPASVVVKVSVYEDYLKKKIATELMTNNKSVEPFKLLSLDSGQDYLALELEYRNSEDLKYVEGIIDIPLNTKEILRIPYSIETSVFKDLKLVLFIRAALDQFPTPTPQPTAIVTIFGQENNVSISHGVVMNDLTEMTTLPIGVYSVTIKANGYKDYHQIISLNYDNRFVTIFMEPEFVYKPTLNGDIITMDKVQMPMNNIPLVTLFPAYINFDGKLDYYKEFVEVNFESGREGTFVVLNSLQDVYSVFKLGGRLFSLKIENLNGTSLCLKCKMKLKFELMSVPNDEKFANLGKGVLIKLDYFVLFRDINWNYKGNSDFLILRKDSEDSLGLSLVNKYEIKCDCYVSTLQKCLSYYQTVTGCSDSWKGLPDEVISIHVFAKFILFKANCEKSGVQMKKLAKLLQCLNDVEDNCPVIKSKSKQSRIFNNFPQQLKNSFISSFPNIKTIENQLASIPKTFQNFFKQLELLIPDDEITEIEDIYWFDNFVKFASEYSQGGTQISDEELVSFSNWHQGRALIFRWNTMQSALQGERIQMAYQLSNSSIKAFQDLVYQADQLKSISRQFDLDTPFLMLQEVMNSLFSNVEAASSLVPSIIEESCKISTAYIRTNQKRIFENGSFKVIVVIKSNPKLKQSLRDIKFDLELVRMDNEGENVQFRIIPISNIYSNEEQEINAEWMITPMSMRRLTEEIRYQPSTSITFKHPLTNDILVQKLNAEIITIVPMEFVRMYWFMFPIAYDENNKQNDRPYTALLSIMNAGYATLENIEVSKIQAYILDAENFNRIPFKISKNDTLLRINKLTSGSSVQIPMDFYTYDNATGILGNITAMLTINNKFPSHIYSRTFIILSIMNSKAMIINEKNSVLPLIHYDIARSRMTPVQEVQTQGIQSEKSEINGKEYIQAKITVNRQNQQNALFGPVIVTANKPEGIVEEDKILEVSTVKNGSRRYLPKDNAWLYGNQLKLVDLDADSSQTEINYFCIFGQDEWNSSFTTVMFETTTQPYTSPGTISSSGTTETLFPKTKPTTKSVISTTPTTRATEFSRVYATWNSFEQVPSQRPIIINEDDFTFVNKEPTSRSKNEDVSSSKTTVVSNGLTKLATNVPKTTTSSIGAFTFFHQETKNEIETTTMTEPKSVIKTEIPPITVHSTTTKLLTSTEQPTIAKQPATTNPQTTTAAFSFFEFTFKKQDTTTKTPELASSSSPTTKQSEDFVFTEVLFVTTETPKIIVTNKELESTTPVPTDEFDFWGLKTMTNDVNVFKPNPIIIPFSQYTTVAKNQVSPSPLFTLPSITSTTTIKPKVETTNAPETTKNSFIYFTIRPESTLETYTPIESTKLVTSTERITLTESITTLATIESIESTTNGAVTQSIDFATNGVATPTFESTTKGAATEPIKSTSDVSVGSLPVINITESLISSSIASVATATISVIEDKTTTDKSPVAETAIIFATKQLSPFTVTDKSRQITETTTPPIPSTLAPIESLSQSSWVNIYEDDRPASPESTKENPILSLLITDPEQSVANACENRKLLSIWAVICDLSKISYVRSRHS